MAGGGGGGGGAAPKADEPQPHPPKDQLPNISYCITSPPPWRAYIYPLFLHFIHCLCRFLSEKTIHLKEKKTLDCGS